MKMERSKILLDLSRCSFTMLPSEQSVLRLSAINMLIHLENNFRSSRPTLERCSEGLRCNIY